MLQCLVSHTVTLSTKPTKIPDMLDAATFAEAYNEAEWYRQGRPDMSSFNPFFSADAIQKYRDGSDPVLYPNTDWANLVTKDYSHQQRVNLQASGGSEKVRYLLSFGVTDQDGNFENDPTNYRQYNTRIRVDVDLTDHLTVGANINGSSTKETTRANQTLTRHYPHMTLLIYCSQTQR